uniref:Putative ovule protein n=1 Tax=Solanum chacoense TaxID=4108 RepID=A0A0V0ISA0_SOLCH
MHTQLTPQTLVEEECDRPCKSVFGQIFPRTPPYSNLVSKLTKLAEFFHYSATLSWLGIANLQTFSSPLSPYFGFSPLFQPAQSIPLFPYCRGVTPSFCLFRALSPLTFQHSMLTIPYWEHGFASHCLYRFWNWGIYLNGFVQHLERIITSDLYLMWTLAPSGLE